MAPKPPRPDRPATVARILLALLLAAVAWGSLTPERVIDLRLENGGKLVHFCAYALLGGLAVRAFPPGRARWRWLAAVVALGGAIEVLQLFVPGRHGALSDALVDALGVAAGGWLGSREPLARAWRKITAPPSPPLPGGHE